MATDTSNAALTAQLYALPDQTVIRHAAEAKTRIKRQGWHAVTTISAYEIWCMARLLDGWLKDFPPETGDVPPAPEPEVSDTKGMEL